MVLRSSAAQFPYAIHQQLTAPACATSCACESLEVGIAGLGSHRWPQLTNAFSAWVAIMSSSVHQFAIVSVLALQLPVSLVPRHTHTHTQHPARWQRIAR